MTAEHERLNEDRLHPGMWKRWGPYLSERQWGTVREDYSSDGNSWDYFSHDQARSRAYRWGEDGLAGISDDKQRLCFALALWNGRDPIIKERLFGLTNREGNHGEDVKEYYYYLDNTPTHSYMKYLYKYPQQAFPYDDLVKTNSKRPQSEPEYDLIDTGIFNDNRYFDILIEYAKAGPNDILIQISAHNRGPEEAQLHILPTWWFRNDWSVRFHKNYARKPTLRKLPAPAGMELMEASHSELGKWWLYCQDQPFLLFTENNTNMERIFGKSNKSPYVKDGINNHLIHHQQGTVNPRQTGTKAAAHYRFNIGAGQSAAIRLRLVEQHSSGRGKKTTNEIAPFGAGFDEILSARLREADEFYAAVIPPSVSSDAANVMRQALAGMLWSKQFYDYNVSEWLKEHKAHPLDAGSRPCRNRDWYHMINADIISMPDKWEYPWYAAWDLAFHTLPLSIVDSDFAKQQMELLLHGFYLHPNGQLPAYEWNFSDVNPPVHAWATLFLYRLEQNLHGTTDLNFLKSAFNKLVVNFTWWVNRKDRFGKNVFEGGFLGLDNIGVFDRSSSLPTGGYLEQADGTAWMALFAQNMVEMSVELAGSDPCYDDMAFKFLEHFYFIAHAINHPGHDSMWDEQDGFYYDVLVCPDGSATRLKVRSMVGLLPLCATTVVEKWQRERIPKTLAAAEVRMRQSPRLFESIHPTGPQHLGVADRGIFALLTPDRLRRILAKMLDENEFLSPYGIRSLSKFHEKNPYLFHVGKQEYRVSYLPAESDTGMFGGNSNWRGPVWMPVNILLIRGLLQFYLYYGDNFKVECPTGSGRMMNLFEVAKEIGERLTRIFLRNEKGRRPVYGSAEKLQNDPHWRDYLLFYEYFHGDNGTGIGASHQTGWTGVIAKIIQIVSAVDPKKVLEAGKKGSIHGQ